MNDPDLPILIQALLEPERYPAGVRQVELVQTHISWVLLAGDFAYKIKKPLKLAFLDFSTLAQRQQCCADELRLNRRFAPDLYLDVVGIFNTAQDPHWDGSGAPIEYAVRMRRFDEAARLDRLCAQGALKPEHVSALADVLHAFHTSAAVAVAPAGAHFGAPEQILAPALENFQELARLGASVAARLAALRAWTEAQFAQLAPLMHARQQSGRVRECHGDLHLGNMVLIGSGVRMFDCIEFNENLRWIDVASEIAFTYVDLLAHGQSGLAGWFVNEALSRSGDYEAALLLRFYAVYRALVRAKVAAIRQQQTGGEVDDVGEAGNAGDALAYLALAERLLVPPSERLVITHGLSGCGKTVASDALLQDDPHAATLRLRSDVERKRLFGLAPDARSGSAMEGGIYAPDAHGRTYGRLREIAHMLLRAGWSVVVDATFLKRADRAAFQALAMEVGVRFQILAPQATPAQLRERIQTRLASGHDASEATLEVLVRQTNALEPLTPEEVLAVLAEITPKSSQGVALRWYAVPRWGTHPIPVGASIR
ncbi:MAG: AAA family ATPase [Rhodoferax sp.]|nr:AAA family ATPase [Rhodoferax sp.]